MRFRIGMLNDKFWVEGRACFIWKRLPDINHFIEWKNIRYMAKYVRYYDTIEQAINEAGKYRHHFDKKSAVYVDA